MNNLGKNELKEEEQELNLMGTNPGNKEEKHNLSEQEDVSAECKSCLEREKEGRVKVEEALRRKTLFLMKIPNTIYVSSQDPPSPHPLQFQKW